MHPTLEYLYILSKYRSEERSRQWYNNSRDFNTPLSAMDRLSRQKINKETLDLNHTLDQMNLTDKYRTFHLTEAEYTFFSSAHGTLSRIYHMIGHKTNLGKFWKTEIIPSTFSNNSGIKLEFNNRKKAGKFISMWELNNTLLNNQ